MAGRQALVCGKNSSSQWHFSPFPSLPCASLTLFLQGGCQTEAEAAGEHLTAAVADSWEPRGLDQRPQRPIMQWAARLTGAQHLTDNSR